MTFPDTTLISTLNMPVTEIQDTSHFWKVMEENEVVIVETYAEWDKPGAAMRPRFERLSEEEDCNKSGILFVRLNVDNLADLSKSLGVTAMPTYIAFHKREHYGRIVGAKTRDVEELVWDTIGCMDG